MNVTQKILSKHLQTGDLTPGTEIGISIDQTLTQDATGTMAYLQFEAMGVERIRTELSVSYIDHNTLQVGYENADDHRFLQTAAARYGAYFSRAGNGICHQVHLERFGRPGATLLGSDSHTPTAGGLGMLGIGVGGLDVAVAMAGGTFYLTMPKIVLVKLTGKLGAWISAKDVILEILRRLTVKGGVGKIMEYGGEGVRTLSVPERATITNMGAELGATTSVFPSDERTQEFLRAQGRENIWVPIKADSESEYEEVIEIDLSSVVPLAAQPHQPDCVVPVAELEGLKVDQVIVGSCTNSSYEDLMKLAGILKGKKVHPRVSASVAPGSRQVLEMIARNGALGELIASGVRILEPACGPCIGMGQSPPSGGVSVRTFNRNFKGRSGTPDAQIYLTSPEVAAAAILTGELIDVRKLGEPVSVTPPEKYIIDDGMIIPPEKDPEKVEVVRGPNIKPIPRREKLPSSLQGLVLLKVGDNITTDDIMPAGAKILRLRSNIPAIAQHVFEGVDSTFAERAQAAGGGFIVGGENYGQGSSREHAALAPMYLGIKAVLAKSFARIHSANLVNFGILPLTFVDAKDYESISAGDELHIPDIRYVLESGQKLTVKNITKGTSFEVEHKMTPRQVEIALAGGMLNFTYENKRSGNN